MSKALAVLPLVFVTACVVADDDPHGIQVRAEECEDAKAASELTDLPGNCGVYGRYIEDEPRRDLIEGTTEFDYATGITWFSTVREWNGEPGVIVGVDVIGCEWITCDVVR